MEHEDIIPGGLEGKTDEERQEIIKHWERLHDFRQAILNGKMPASQHQMPELEEELSRVSKQLEPREPLPDSGILVKDDKKYILCPRCGTFVHITKERIDEVIWELEETPDSKSEDGTSTYLIRSINCPICRWGLGIPEGL
jgi:hypothetical protein